MTNAFSKFSKTTSVPFTRFDMLFTKESISNTEYFISVEDTMYFYGLPNTPKTQKAVDWMRKTILMWIMDGDLDKTFRFSTRNDTLLEASNWTRKYRCVFQTLLYSYSIFNDGPGNGNALCEFVDALKEAGYEFSSIISVVKSSSATLFQVNEKKEYSPDENQVYEEIVSNIGIFTTEEMAQKDKVVEDSYIKNIKKAEIQKNVDAELAKRAELQRQVDERNKQVNDIIDDIARESLDADYIEKFNKKVGLCECGEQEATPVRIRTTKTCFCGCGTQATKMLRPASKCGARYVNAEHQLNAWKEHKANCETCFKYSQNEKAKRAERNYE